MGVGVAETSRNTTSENAGAISHGDGKQKGKPTRCYNGISTTLSILSHTTLLACQPISQACLLHQITSTGPRVGLIKRDLLGDDNNRHASGFVNDSMHVQVELRPRMFRADTRRQVQDF